jgi:rhamnulokinase
MRKKTVLAIDIGAESGRVVAVGFDGKMLQVEELHRFPNIPVTTGGTLYWDLLNLWHEIQIGIEKGKSFIPVSMGVDTWGVDFGLLDKQGKLIGNPVHYRDSRTRGMMEKVFKIVSRGEIFSETGIQFMPINTLYQMMSLLENDASELGIAHSFLTIPDILNYWLTGVKVCEFTNATTTQMVNPMAGDWAKTMLNKLGIPIYIFPDIVQPGTKLGNYDGFSVIAPACHDTGSAVAAVPDRGSSYAYISSGTWSLVGLEVKKPALTKEALKANVTNEGGIGGTYRLLKNVMGLWIVQQCNQSWKSRGKDYSYEKLTKLAEVEPGLRSFIDPDDSRFLSPGDHQQLVRNFCLETDQPVPDTPAAIIRCVLESLALVYRDVIEKLQRLSKRKLEVIHIVGGGAKNELLNQMTANATGIPVVAGPVEATVIGNALVQFIALKEIGTIKEGRQLVAQMNEIKHYRPCDRELWDEAYERYKKLLF